VLSSGRRESACGSIYWIALCSRGNEPENVHSTSEAQALKLLKKAHYEAFITRCKCGGPKRVAFWRSLGFPKLVLVVCSRR